jgi:hypothetical protein
MNVLQSIVVGLIAVLGVIALVIVLGVLLAYPVMLLWNGCAVPAFTILQPIGWLQAWGLLVLGGLLFKSSCSSSSK